MKKVLFLDRQYTTLYVRSNEFESIYVALSKKHKKELQRIGCNVVSCFEEEYDSIPIVQIPEGYLIYSFSIDRFLNRFSHAQRKDLLSKEISFWRTVLDKYHPDLIVGELCTIEWMEVLYIEASKRGIEYKSFLRGSSPDTFYWTDTPFNSEISEERWNNTIVDNCHREKAIQFVEGTISKQLKPVYVANVKINAMSRLISGVKFLLYSFLEHIQYRGHFQYEDYRKQAKQNLDNIVSYIFRKYEKTPVLNEIEYVFYPLHYEPEATISYFTEFFSDQANVIAGISDCLKTNQVLIVKEHPQQFGVLLTKRFRKIKESHCNVIYVPSTVSAIDIINSCRAIVTLTGTAGYEGLMVGKPVITLGKVFYNHCPGTMHVESFAELKKIIRGDKYYYPKKDQVIDFVSSFMALQSEGNPFLDQQLKQERVEQLTVIIERLLNK